MRLPFFFSTFVLFAVTAHSWAASPSVAPAPKWVLAIHGGAGGLPKDLPPAEVDRIRNAMTLALETAGGQLASGLSSMDAVETAVRIMEDSCVFNSGCGAVLDHNGDAVLDASIMNGDGKTAGAVAGTRHIANPIVLARAVMERSPHVLFIGDGAEAFAQSQGMTLRPREYFITERRSAEWRRAVDAEKKSETAPASDLPKGTVGAVAMDTQGRLAAATSTGGLANKRVGRIGDSPIIGAGTYAEDGVCAVSATGAGEYFIRYTAAGDICARIRYKKESVDAAATGVLKDMQQAGGAGGVIVLDGQGNVAMPFTTATMMRGTISADHGLDVVVEVGGANEK